MKFLAIYKSVPNAPPPTPATLVELGKFTEEMMRTRKVVMTGGIVRPTKGTKVSMSAAGDFAVTDGPYPETKELIDGFAILEAASKDEAIELCRRFMKVAGEGEGELLQLFEPPSGPP